MSAAPLHQPEGGRLASGPPTSGPQLDRPDALEGYDPSPSLPDPWSLKIHPKG